MKIFDYRRAFTPEMMLIDDWVSIGSCNFDHWNLHFNLEANLEALDPALTRAVQPVCHLRAVRRITFTGLAIAAFVAAGLTLGSGVGDHFSGESLA